MITNTLPSEEATVLTTCFKDIGAGQCQVVRQTTNVHPPLTATDELVQSLSLTLRLKLRGLEAETILSFWECNKHPFTIHTDLLPSQTIIPLTESETDEIFTDINGWNRFRRVYPYSQGILEFSRVGFNSIQTQALVYTGLQVDWRAGHGDYWLYTHVDTQWTKTAIFNVWMS